MIRTDSSPRLIVSTDWIPIEITSDFFLILTFRGYAPACEACVIPTGLKYTLLLGAKSLSDAIEPLRLKNGGGISGIKASIRKQGTERTSAYEIRGIG